MIRLLTINKENRLKKKAKELTEKQDEIDLMKIKYERKMQEMNEKLKI